MTRLFDELGLNKELLLALKENGYTTPFPIQEKAIPIILQGNDVIGQAHTGTGKTARLRSIFGLSERPGLSSILSSEITDAEMLAVVSRDEVTGLNVLTSGPIPPNPAELLGSDQMRRLMKVLQAEFTHLVVDSPPVSSFTDGVLISSMVDG